MDKFLYTALYNYFKYLGNYGYLSYERIKRLLYLSYTEELLRTHPEFMTEEEHQTIVTTINCIAGTDCLLPSTTIRKSSCNICQQTPQMFPYLEDCSLAGFYI